MYATTSLFHWIGQAESTRVPTWARQGQFPEFLPRMDDLLKQRNAARSKFRWEVTSFHACRALSGHASRVTSCEDPHLPATWDGNYQVLQVYWRMCLMSSFLCSCVQPVHGQCGQWRNVDRCLMCGRAIRHQRQSGAI